MTTLDIKLSEKNSSFIYKYQYSKDDRIVIAIYKQIKYSYKLYIHVTVHRNKFVSK